MKSSYNYYFIIKYKMDKSKVIEIKEMKVVDNKRKNK